MTHVRSAPYVLILSLFVVAIPRQFAAANEDWGDAVILSEKTPANVGVPQVEFDGTGVLWGLVNRSLAKWSEGAWNRISMSQSGTDATARTRGDDHPDLDNCLDLAPGPDGSVLVLPMVSDDSPILQVRGDRARWMEAEHGDGSQWGLYRDAAETPWLILGDPAALMIDARSPVDPLLRLFDGPEPIKALVKGLERCGLPAMKMVEDGQGRFWNPYEHPSHWSWRRPMWMPVVLVPGLDPGEVRTPPIDSVTPSLFFVADDSEGYVLHNSAETRFRWNGNIINFIRPTEEGGLWVGTSEYGLLELEAETLRGKQAVVAGHPRFTEMTQVFRFGDSWIGLCNSTTQDRAQAVCKLVGDTWKVLVDPLGSCVPRNADPRVRRPCLVTERGAWVGAGERAGVVFVPLDGGEPVRFDWERGLPVPTPSRIVETPEGDLLFISASSDYFVISESELLATKPVESRLDVLALPSNVFQTADGAIWYASTKRNGRICLSRWEDGDWRPFEQRVGPFVSSQEDPPLAGACGDRENRIWVALSPPYDVAYIVTPPLPGEEGNGTWRPFDHYGDAVLSEGVTRDDFLQPWDGGETQHFQIARHDDGRVAFKLEDVVYYHDGAKWLTWDDDSVLKVRSYYGEPVFDDAGKLHYKSSYDHWIYDGEGEWADHPDNDDNALPLTPKRRSEVPPYAPRGKPTSKIMDREGTQWLQYGKAVYRAACGICLPVIAGDEASPFGRHTFIRDVFVAPNGDVLFKSHLAVSVLAPGLLPPVETRVVCDPVTPDSVCIDPQSGVMTGAKWHTWRIDGGPWQDAFAGSYTVKGMTEGRHIVEVTAIGPKFALDPTPARFEIEIRITGDDIDRWIADLASGDERARYDAIESLARMPHALPALRKALETSPPDARWWIEVAIQTIERDATATDSS